MRGDHVYVKRALYTHHGIDLGDGRVVHYSGEPGSKANARVVVSMLAEFLCGGRRRVRRYRDPLPRAETVRRALSRVGESGYNLFLSNCEHFASWCRTGDARSRQIERAARAVGRLLGLVPARRGK